MLCYIVSNFKFFLNIHVMSLKYLFVLKPFENLNFFVTRKLFTFMAACNNHYPQLNYHNFIHPTALRHYGSFALFFSPLYE